MNELREHVTFRGDEELIEALLAIPVSLRPHFIQPALAAGGKVIQKEAKRRAPVRTGRLRDSIEVEPAGQVRVRVSVKAPYARLVEFGTRTPRGVDSPEWTRGKRAMPLGDDVYRAQVGPMPADPFFLPAVQQKRGKAMEVIEEKLWERIRTAWLKP